MKMCLAPCFKGCSDARYAEEAQAVGEYLATRGGSLIRSIAAARDAASEALDFELAAERHAAMTKVQAAAHLADEMVRPVDRLDAVMVQAGIEGQVALFMVRAGQLAGPVKFALAAELEPEEQVREALAALESMLPEASGRARGASRRLGCDLALLRRWYYRSEKQRKGEIFFRNEDGKFPMRRIVNAVGRASNRELKEGIQADAQNPDTTAAADTLVVE